MTRYVTLCRIQLFEVIRQPLVTNIVDTAFVVPTYKPAEWNESKNYFVLSFYYLSWLVVFYIVINLFRIILLRSI